MKLTKFKHLVGPISVLLFLSQLDNPTRAWATTRHENTAYYAVDQSNNPTEIASILGWQTTNDPNSLCKGYFLEPGIVSRYPYPLPASQEQSRLTARGPTLFRQRGLSILQKDVLVTQPGRLVRADKAYVYRDPKTLKITRIKLKGHVRLREAGKYLAGPSGELNLEQHTADFGQALYHIYARSPKLGKFNAWGKARKAKRLSDGVIKVWHGTYTTCSPTNPTWQMHASYIKLDKKNNVGHARNVVIRFLGIPIFYVPYYSFPLNHARKTGFLSPNISISKNNGFGLGVPFYWNMAPNYDLLMTPAWLTKRGFKFSTLFRYLTHSGSGSIYLSGLPHDKGFVDYKNNILRQFANNTNPAITPFLNDLRNSKSARGFIAIKDHSQFSDEWSAHMDVNAVSDDYYLRDYGADFATISANQLLNQGDVSYLGSHWNVFAMAQAYQTVHLIDQPPTINQYMRLPEIDIGADYPNAFAGTNVLLGSQYVNFAYDSMFPPVTSSFPIGQRLHLRPSVNHPFTWASGYITPQIAIDNTNYSTQLPRPTPFGPRPWLTAARTLPIINIDSGMYFDRNIMLGGHSYTQTLEPRAFYLFVPYLNQNRYPVFDTQILPFNFDQLFALNRFSGFDRLQNASQLSLGLTSRILNGDTSYQILRFDLGLIYYFSHPRVTLPGVPIPPTRSISPIVGQITYYPGPGWSITGSAAWDTRNKLIDNDQVGVTYTPDGRHVATMSYVYLHALSNQPSNTRTSQLRFGVAWPIYLHLSALAYTYYDFAQKRFNSYYGGLQVDGCCFAIRLVVNRVNTGVAPGTNRNTYDTRFFFQLLLIGMGSVGNSDPNSLLTSTLSGYHNRFTPPYTFR